MMFKLESLVFKTSLIFSFLKPEPMLNRLYNIWIGCETKRHDFTGPLYCARTQKEFPP